MLVRGMIQVVDCACGYDDISGPVHIAQALPGCLGQVLHIHPLIENDDGLG